MNMNNDSQMPDWSYLPTQALPLSSQGGIVPQNPSHLKPPTEVLSTSSRSFLEEDKEGLHNYLLVGSTFPCQQRLASPTEESFSPFRETPVTVRSEPPVASPIFGNSLGVQGSSNNVQSVSIVPSDVDVQSVSGDVAETSTTRPFELDAPNVVNNNNNSSRVKLLLESNVGNLCAVNNTSGCLSPTVSNTNPPAFQPEPIILAEKYAILGPVDASTSHGIHLWNHQPVHVKAVSARTAREVCAQQSLLDQNVGVRAPNEAIVSKCGKRAWLVFPPHYGDLHSYVRLRRRLREAEAQRLFAQVAETVEMCHSSGLVLRDLKLRKFVFTDFNRQRVVLESVEDSVVAGESDLLHDKHGCPAYVAPEILSAAAYSGRHADMWGLGVILYTMLVGRYPFHNADTTTLFAKIRSGKFFIPEWVSSRARHLILSLLRRQPQRRLSARQVLQHPWLNRVPRDHVGKDPQDHIVPSEITPVQLPSIGKARPPHQMFPRC